MSLDIRPNPSASAGGITGGLVYKGSYNATTNTPDLTSSDKGDFYIVSVGGTLAGITLDVGDHIVFNQDAASPITSAMFDKIDNTDAVASVNTQTGVVVLDSDDIAEGTTNLYYTNARFDTQLATKDSDDIAEGTTNLYYTNARFDTQLGTKDTGDLSEGSNLYYTNARADARIGAANLTDLNDVNYSAGVGINGYVLEYVHANTRWEAKVPATAPVSSVNTQTGAVVLDSDDIAEGTANLYYTNARFDTQLATKDTDDVSEGTTNLYYTNARFDTQLATKDTDDVSEGTTNLYYTNARFDAQLGTKNTGDLAEGSNLYYTNARADARIGAANLTDLNDVNYTAGAGIDGQFLKYVNANSRWEAAAAPTSSDTLDDVVGRGATTSTPITVGDLKINSDSSGASTSGSIATLASNNNIKLDPHGSGVAELVGNATRGSGQVQFNCEQNSHGIILKGPPHSAGASYTMILPDGLGTTGQYLKLEDAGTGELSFDTPAGGGFSYTAITSASSPVTSAISTHYGADSSGGVIVFNLPALSGLTGGEEIRIKLNTAGNNLTLTPNGSDTIEGAASYVMSIAKESVTCVASSGTNWEII
jgi:hypothetical protein